jgi:hypothetical protein
LKLGEHPGIAASLLSYLDLGQRLGHQLRPELKSELQQQLQGAASIKIKHLRELQVATRRKPGFLDHFLLPHLYIAPRCPARDRGSCEKPLGVGRARMASALRTALDELETLLQPSRLEYVCETIEHRLAHAHTTLPELQARQVGPFTEQAELDEKDTTRRSDSPVFERPVDAGAHCHGTRQPAA